MTGSRTPDALAHLGTYHLDAAIAAGAAAARGWSAVLDSVRVDARAGTPVPFALAGRGLRWWETALEHDEPGWHLSHETVLRAPFARLLDVTRPADRNSPVVPTLVLPPQAGHASTIVDFSPTQSQLGTIRAAGLVRLSVLDWLPATAETAEVTITDHLDIVDRAVRHMGGRANLVGDCQGGWLAAIYAALHPDRVHTLTLAGAPIDFHAGDSVIASTTRVLTDAFGLAPYRTLVALGGGVMPGAAALANFLTIAPQAEVARQLELLAHVDDPAHVARYREFADWFTHTQDIPGAFYLWLVEHLFRRNELARGELVVDGRGVDLGAITCPLHLLAGSTDHITPAAQVFAAADAVGTPVTQITTAVADGGHLGLFMGRAALRREWPRLLADVYDTSRTTGS